MSSTQGSMRPSRIARQRRCAQRSQATTLCVHRDRGGEDEVPFTKPTLGLRMWIDRRHVTHGESPRLLSGSRPRAVLRSIIRSQRHAPSPVHWCPSSPPLPSGPIMKSRRRPVEGHDHGQLGDEHERLFRLRRLDRHLSRTRAARRQGIELDPDPARHRRVRPVPRPRTAAAALHQEVAVERHHECVARRDGRRPKP